MIFFPDHYLLLLLLLNLYYIIIVTLWVPSATRYAFLMASTSLILLLCIACILYII